MGLLWKERIPQQHSSQKKRTQSIRMSSSPPQPQLPPTKSSTSVESQERTVHVLCGCAGATRYIILTVGVLFLASLQSSVLSYNANFVQMMDKTSSPLYNGSIDDDIDWNSPDLPMNDRRFSYGFIEKSLSFAGAYAGSMMGTFPMSMLMQRFGAHKVMTAIGIGATITTAIHPIIVCTSFPLFVVLRVVSGLAISNLFPVAGVIVNEWAVNEEKGIFIAVLSGYVELAALFTMPISGFVGTSVSWPAVFYLHAAVCGFLTLLWTVCYRDKPVDHPFVAEEEFEKIHKGKSTSTKKIEYPIVKIVKTFSIWAIWVAVMGNYLVIQFSVSFSPMYLNYVLGYHPSTAGYIIIIPLVLLLTLKAGTGVLSDRVTCISELSKLRLFNSLALLGSGIFFILLGTITPGGGIGDVILVVIPISLLGFSSGGFPKAVVMVARQYSPFVMSVVQIVACLALTLGSFLVPVLTPDDTFNQWRNVFEFYAAVVVISNSIFIAMAKSEPAKWTHSNSVVTMVTSIDSVPVKKEVA